MPLIILTGIPGSGKTTRSKELSSFFHNKGKEVLIVSEYEEILKAGFDKNSLYLDSSKEKHLRSALKSEVIKVIGKNGLVILDGLNYIKGYRYELYCAAKANKCTQCTIQTEINQQIAWEWNEKRAENEKYNKEIFDALIMRYESPDGKNRWDSPLFVVFPEDPLKFDEIFVSLFENKPPPPNQSTQNAPLSSTNFLYELDKITKEITDRILRAKSLGSLGEIKIPDYNLTIDISNVTTSKLMMLRRQYITYSKMHTPDVNQIPQLYIQYLKTSLNSQ